MGVELVEFIDLWVEDGFVLMWMMWGYQLIDVFYCCVDDDYFDLLIFNLDSMLGVSGIMDVYCVGNIIIVNVSGMGIVDDKVFYFYMFDIVEFYIGEQVILKNVLIWCCFEEDSLKYVLDNFVDLVVKEVYGFGGYGMFVGFVVFKKEIVVFECKFCVWFVNYIVQLMFLLLMVLILIKVGFVLCYVDLCFFVFVLFNCVDIMSGGLICVVLKKGFLVVNFL